MQRRRACAARQAHLSLPKAKGREVEGRCICSLRLLLRLRRLAKAKAGGVESKVLLLLLAGWCLAPLLRLGVRRCKAKAGCVKGRVCRLHRLL